MPSPEGAPRGDESVEDTPVGTPEERAPDPESAVDDSEAVGEEERKTYGERGKKVYEAMTAERRAELLRRREQIIARQREIEKELAMLLEGGAELSDDAKKVVEKADGTGAPEEKPADKPADKPEEEPVAAPVGGATEEAPEAPAEAPATEGEKAPDAEKLKEAKERAKKNGGLRRYITGAAAIALAGIIAFFAGKGGNTEDNKDPNIGSNRPAVTTMAPGATTAETAEQERGIYDGYGEKGMYLSEHKTSSVAFANATEVAEVCNFDEVDMIKYTAHNQVESFADYLANLPEELQPEGFKGLSILETEAALEALSDEDFEALEGQFGSIMDNAFTRRVTLNGTYDNAYMRVKNPGEAITHENMELVRCSTEEHNLEVTQFYWVDASGREIGHMTVKITPTTDEKGRDTFRGCEQVVTQGESDIYEGMPEIPTPEPEPTPTPPTPEPEPTPTPPLPPKDPAEEIAHAGPDVTPFELDETVTPPTTIEQDLQNFEAIEQQQRDDAAAAAEAARVAAEQQQNEQAAAAEAAARRQAEAALAQQQTPAQAAAEAVNQTDANQDAAAAYQGAAADIQQAAPAEQAAAAEATSRQESQDTATAAAVQAEDAVEANRGIDGGARTELDF